MSRARCHSSSLSTANPPAGALAPPTLLTMMSTPAEALVDFGDHPVHAGDATQVGGDEHGCRGFYRRAPRRGDDRRSRV
jgi:hypothetical protein